MALVKIDATPSVTLTHEEREAYNWARDQVIRWVRGQKAEVPVLDQRARMREALLGESQATIGGDEVAKRWADASRRAWAKAFG